MTATTIRPLAVVIGITAYREPRLVLSSPTNDARRLAEHLEREHGYEVWLRCDEDATRDALHALFERTLPPAVEADRRVLVYFAGHGIAVDSVDDPHGYLVPTDGTPALDSLVAMQRLYEALAQLRCRHLLLVLDCCFAGSFRWAAGRNVVVPVAPTMYRERYERFLATPAWQVITSAAYDEQAADVVAGYAVGRRDADGGAAHSPFLHALIAGLSGAADTSPRPNGDGVISATELYLHLREQLETGAEAAAGRTQTPGLWPLRRHEKGEYIFHTPGKTAVLPSAKQVSRENSPYRGFEVYEQEHADRFFGRSAATAALRARVETWPITVVVGSSGTGKSSVVRAGLIPALRAAHPDWHIDAPIRPGKTPVATLNAAIAALPAGRSAVLVVDQLEELFAVPERADQRGPFLARLVDVTASGAVRVVGTLRADLETELWASPLAGTWQQIRFPLGDMTRDELREAIERPAEEMVLSFDPPEMVERLIDTVVAMPGALPLLSFTLDKLYVDCLERAAGDRTLRETTATGVGGIAVALREHADRIYDGFDEATRATMRRLLLRMVAVKGSAISRRQVTRDELEVADRNEAARIRAVIDALTGGAYSKPETAAPGLRLAVLGSDGDPLVNSARATAEHARVAFVELAHDAVARDWPRLKAWRETSQGDLILHRALTTAAREWMAAGRPAGRLWHDDPRLPLVRDLLVDGVVGRATEPPAQLTSRHQLSVTEAEFIARSRARRRRRRAVLAVLIPVAVIAAVFAYTRYREEQTQRQIAQDSSLAERGARAGAQSHVLGQELLALVAATATLREAMGTGRPIPPTVIAGAIEAIGGGRPVELPRLDQPAIRLACDRSGQHVIASDLDTGTLIAGSDGQELGRLSQTTTAVAFTPNGVPLLSAGGAITAKPFDGPSRQLVESSHVLSAMAIAPDGSFLVAASMETNAIELWRLDVTPPTLSELGRFDDYVDQVVISTDGTLVAAGSFDGTARVWRVGEAAPVLAIPATSVGNDAVGNHVVRVRSVALSPDGRQLVVGNAAASVWDVESKQRLIELPTEQVNTTFYAAYLPDGTELITVGMDRVIRRWDARTFLPLGFGPRAPTGPNAATICGDSIVVSGNESLQWIPLDRDNSLARAGTAGRRALAAALAPDGTSMFVGIAGTDDRPAAIEHWALHPPALVESPVSIPGYAAGMDFDVRDGQLAVVADGLLLRWALGQHGRMSADPDPRSFPLLEARGGFFSPNGRFVAMASLEGGTGVWVTATGAPLGTIPAFHAGISSGAVSADGKKLAIVGLQEGMWRAELWTLDAMAPDAVFDSPGDQLATVALSPSGTRLAAAGLYGTVTIWDVETRRAVSQLFGHVGTVWTVQFSLDGQMIATGGDDGTARLWDAATGQLLGVLVGHRDRVFKVAFTPDGAHLVTSSFDGTAAVYQVTARGIYDQACARLGAECPR